MEVSKTSNVTIVQHHMVKRGKQIYTSKVVHGKIKDFICVTFFRNIGDKFQLSTHLKTVPAKIKYFKCDTTLKAFCDKGQLSTHLKTMPAKMKELKCDISLKGI